MLLPGVLKYVHSIPPAGCARLITVSGVFVRVLTLGNEMDRTHDTMEGAVPACCCRERCESSHGCGLVYLRWELKIEEVWREMRDTRADGVELGHSYKQDTMLLRPGPPLGGDQTDSFRTPRWRGFFGSLPHPVLPVTLSCESPLCGVLALMNQL